MGRPRRTAAAAPSHQPFWSLYEVENHNNIYRQKREGWIQICKRKERKQALDRVDGYYDGLTTEGEGEGESFCDPPDRTVDTARQRMRRWGLVEVSPRHSPPPSSISLGDRSSPKVTAQAGWVPGILSWNCPVTIGFADDDAGSGFRHRGRHRHGTLIRCKSLQNYKSATNTVQYQQQDLVWCMPTRAGRVPRARFHTASLLVCPPRALPHGEALFGFVWCQVAPQPSHVPHRRGGGGSSPTVLSHEANGCRRRDVCTRYSR